jgi:hypothetical protein
MNLNADVVQKWEIALPKVRLFALILVIVLKFTSTIETMVPALLSPADLGRKLELKNIQVTSIAGDNINFKDDGNVLSGTYNAATGKLAYQGKKVPCLFQLHKVKESAFAKSVGVLYGALWVFLGATLLRTQNLEASERRRGIVLSVSGVLLLLLFLFAA